MPRCRIAINQPHAFTHVIYMYYLSPRVFFNGGSTRLVYSHRSGRGYVRPRSTVQAERGNANGVSEWVGLIHHVMIISFLLCLVTL